MIDYKEPQPTPVGVNTDTQDSKLITRRKAGGLVALAAAGSFALGSLLGPRLPIALNQPSQPESTPSSPTAEIYTPQPSTNNLEINIPGGEVSPSTPGTIDVVSGKDQNKVLIAQGATVERIDRTAYDSIVYLRIPGKSGKNTVQEAYGGASEISTVEQFAGTEIGIRVGMGTEVYTLEGDPKLLGRGIDYFSSRVKIGDQLPYVDILLSLDASPADSVTEGDRMLVNQNQQALSSLESGNNNGTNPPVFNAFFLAVNP